MKKQRLAISAVLFWCILAVSGGAWCGNNGNGTVTVNGLVWLEDAGCLGRMNWDSAMSRAKSLAHGQCNLTDNSKIGDWRLPTLDELKAVYAYKGQFKGVQPDYYWSTSTYTYGGHTTLVWYVGMVVGNMVYGYKDQSKYVWPVRAGQ